MTCHRLVVLFGLALLTACPQTLPALEQPSGQVVAVVPNHGFAANAAREFAGTRVEITLADFGAADRATVYFGDVVATRTERAGDVVAAWVPTGARSGAIAVDSGGGRATSNDNFTVLGTPQVNAIEPDYGFSWRGPGDRCGSADDDAAALLLPVGPCPDSGTPLHLRGDNLGIEGDTSWPRVLFGDQALPATVRAASRTLVEVCIPAGLWSATFSEIPLRLTTPAGEIVPTQRAIIAGCPSITQVDPPAAYEQATLTIYGTEFANDPLLVAVGLKSATSTAVHTGVQVLSASRGMLVVKVPGGTVEAGDVQQFSLVVATPAGRAIYQTPFWVMGRPTVDQVSPELVFRNSAATLAGNPWSIDIGGRGFDISSTAANVVELISDSEVGVRLAAEVIAAGPRQLSALVPTDVSPGRYHVMVTTVAGASEFADCPPEDGTDIPGGVYSTACVRVAGPPAVNAFLPARVAWGDVVTVGGGPFDQRNPKAMAAALIGADGTSRTVEVLAATQELLLVHLGDLCSGVGVVADIDGGGGRGDVDGSIHPSTDAGMPGPDAGSPALDAGSSPHDAGWPLGSIGELRLRVTTTAGSNIDQSVAPPQLLSPPLHIVDSTLRLSDTRPDAWTISVSDGSVHWPGPTLRATAAARSPYYFFYGNQAFWIVSALGEHSEIYPVDNVDAMGVSAHGDRLYAAQTVVPLVRPTTKLLMWASDVQRGSLLFDSPHEQPDFALATGFDAEANRVTRMAAGRSRDFGGRDRLLLVTEQRAASPCTEHTIHLVEDALSSTTLHCSSNGYFAQDVYFADDEDGVERSYAVLDLNAGCRRYVAAPGATGTQLDWACRRTRTPTDTCLALVELSCHTASAGMPSLEVTPKIQGLPLPARASILHAPIGRTASVVIDGWFDAQWARLVDYANGVPCEQVLNSCSDSDLTTTRFVPPALEWYFGQLWRPAQSDGDLLFALSSGGGEVAFGGEMFGGGLSALRAERATYSTPFPLPLVEFSYQSDTLDQQLGALATNGFGSVALVHDDSAAPDKVVALTRPRALPLRFVKYGIGMMRMRMGALADSVQVVEPAVPAVFGEPAPRGCGGFGDRPCLVFAGSPTCPEKELRCPNTSAASATNAWAVDLFDPNRERELRRLMVLPQMLTTSREVEPTTLLTWNGQVCAIADFYQDASYSALYCIRYADVGAVRPPVLAAETALFDVKLARPHVYVSTPDSLIIGDDFTPALVFVSQSGGAAYAWSIQLELPAGVTSVLLRRSSGELLMATVGGIYRINPKGGGYDPSTGERIPLAQRMFVNESLPPVPLHLIEPWSRGCEQQEAIFLYYAESQEPRAPHILAALDVTNERVLGQGLTLARFSDAILARHGQPPQLLFGRAAPPGIAQLDLESRSLQSFASLPTAEAANSIESMWMTTDGRFLLAVDNTGELFYTF